MRIGFLTYALNRGGRSRILCRLANGLAETGHDIVITMLTGQPIDYPLSVPVQRVTQIVPEMIPPADLLVPSSFGLLEPALESGQGRTVRFCTEFEPDQVYDVRAALESYRRPVPSLTVSRPVAERLQQLNGQVSMIARPGVDTSVFSAGGKCPSSSISRIGYVYRPSALGYGYKCNDDFWAAIRSVKEAEPDVQVVLLAPDRLPVSGPTPFTFVEPSSDREVADFYRSLDLLVSASRSEGYSLSTLEAMACGTPVVVTEAGGVTDYAVPGKNCFMGLPGHVPMLSDLILAAVRRPDMCETFATAGMQTARERTWGRFVKEADQALCVLASRS